jgi:hypothetical protein
MAALCCRLCSRCEVPSIGRRLGGPTKRGFVHGFGLQGPQNRWRAWAITFPMLIRRTVFSEVMVKEARVAHGCPAEVSTFSMVTKTRRFW